MTCSNPTSSPFPKFATVLLSLSVVMSITVALSAQDDKPSDGESDRSRWVRLDCLTSGCHAGLSAPKFVHAPVSQGACDACHEVSDALTHTFKEVDGGSEGCLDCHEALGEVLATPDILKSTHFPVTEGDCISCHDPHSASLSALVRSSYRQARYGRFDEDHFELCFQCHDAELVSDVTTDDATGFRNGDVNLHHLHVGGDGKGRNCQTCHVAHASVQGALMREFVMFKKWKMPLQYLPTETGGSCGPSCHAPASYDREDAVTRSTRGVPVP